MSNIHLNNSYWRSQNFVFPELIFKKIYNFEEWKGTGKNRV